MLFFIAQKSSIMLMISNFEMFFKLRKIFLVFLIAIVFLGAFWLISEPAQHFFFVFSSPVEKVFLGAGQRVSTFFSSIPKIGFLNERNQILLEENLELKKNLVDLSSIKKENEKLRKALSLNIQEDYQLEIAKVVSRETDRDFILISKGKAEGISEGMPVISEEKVLIGKVEEVFSFCSKVKLISNEEIVFDIKFIGEERENILGIARGTGNSKLTFDLVPRECCVKNGDVVATAALGGKFPEGLLVGEVSEILKSDVEPHQKGEIDLYFNKILLKDVFLILNFRVGQ